MPHLIRKTLRRLALAAGLALPAAASAGYSQIYVLGDSLSDVGNIEAAYTPIVAANGGVPLPILGLAAPGTPSAYAPSRASNGPWRLASLPRPGFAGRPARRGFQTRPNV